MAINDDNSLKTHDNRSKLVAFDSIRLTLQKHVSFVEKSSFITKRRRFSCLSPIISNVEQT